jgi:hypothetical protein
LWFSIFVFIIVCNLALSSNEEQKAANSGDHQQSPNASQLLNGIQAEYIKKTLSRLTRPIASDDNDTDDDDENKRAVKLTHAPYSNEHADAGVIVNSKFHDHKRHHQNSSELNNV